MVTTAVIDGHPDTPKQPTASDFVAPYVHHVDKLFETVPKSCPPSAVKNCGLWATIGQCEKGHRFAARIFCGKPYHAACREIIHQRKVGRGMPRIQTIEAMGKIIVRPPDELQPLLRSKEQRADFTKRVADAVISVGYARLMWFKHDFGEKSTKYAFHLEVIVDGGRLEHEALQELKRKLRRLIYPRGVIRRWGDTLDIWYRYYKTPKLMVHALRYATHPTFLDIKWDERLAYALQGERYSGYRGKWRDQPVKWQLSKHDRHLKSLVDLEKGKCPTCGSPMSWSKRLYPFVLILMEEPTKLSGGYYALPSIRPPPAAPPPTNLIELPDGDPRKHPNDVRWLVDQHRKRLSNLALARARAGG